MKASVHPLGAPVDLTSCLADPRGYLWSRYGEGYAGWDDALRIEPGTGPGRFERAEHELSEFFGSLDGVEPQHPPVAFASFTFDDEIPGSVVAVPSTLVGRRAGTSWLTYLGEQRPEIRTYETSPFEVRYAGSSVSELDWIDAVARAVKQIQGTDLRKVVLARDIHIWSKTPFDVRSILRRLSRRFAECYTFAVDGFLGATPELLLGKRGSQITSLVLAGSAPRADGPDDRSIGDALLASEKDRDEHILAVDSVTEVLEEIAEGVVVEPPHLLKLANVQHIATKITATVPASASSLAIVSALHPTAAVCGTPRAEAAQAIRSLEGLNRARYAGPVGWTAPNGDGQWGIALRCAEIDGTRGRLFAGGGIVAASEPEEELEETRVKFHAVMSALGRELG